MRVEGKRGRFREDDQVKCSFCGKWQKAVRKIVAGPGVYICNECVDLCNDIFAEELAAAPPDRAAEAKLAEARRLTSRLAVLLGELALGGGPEL